jgi:membrane protease YdiL (CAAX protease family)
VEGLERRILHRMVGGWRGVRAAPAASPPGLGRGPDGRGPYGPRRLPEQRLPGRPAEPGRTERSSRAGALLCAVLLAAYGNLFTAVAWRLEGPVYTVLSLAGPLSLLTAVLVWHRLADRRPFADLGLHGRRWRVGLLWGVCGGLLLAAPPLAYFLVLPVTAGTGLRVAEVHNATWGALLLRLLVFTPILVALVEEVAFRGFLLGRLRRALPQRTTLALLLSALAFALWHVTVNLLTLGETNVASAGLTTVPVAVAAGLLSVFVAGLVFGGLYLRTGGLAAPVLAHWLVDALMLIALATPAGGA